MKTFKNLLVIVLVSTFTISGYAALVIPASPVSETVVKGSDIMVRAIYSNGEWMPVVDLPEVEIIGNHTSPSVYKGVVIHGELIASVELPVVEITAIRIEGLHATLIFENSFETVYDLPVVEIVGSFPLEKLAKGESVNGEYMAVVDLPEITITANQFDFETMVNQFSLVSKASNPKAKFETSSNSTFLVHLVQTQNGDKNYKYYSISIDNCIISEQSRKICELIIRLGGTAVSGIKENLIGVVQPH